MKKITLFLSLLLAYTGFSQPVITAVIDGTCTGGTPKVVEIYAKGTVDFSNYSMERQTNANTTWGATFSLASFGTVTNDFVYVYYDGSNDNFTTEFPSAASKPSAEDNVVSINGDDRVRIIDNNSAVVDIFGEDGVDGTGTAWEYRDSYAKRNDNVGPNATFTVSEWTFGGPDVLDNKCSQSDSTPLEQDIPGGIQDYTLAVGSHQMEGLKLYPNPVTAGYFSIQTANDDTKTVRVFDILGKQMIFAEVQNGEKIDVSSLKQGLYFVKIKDSENNTATIKLIIK